MVEIYFIFQQIFQELFFIVIFPFQRLLPESEHVISSIIIIYASNQYPYLLHEVNLQITFVKEVKFVASLASKLSLAELS